MNKQLLGTLALVLTLTLTSCGAGGTQSPELFGTWAWNENELYHTTFNADGTGTRGLPDEIESFRWSNPEPGRLTITRDRLIDAYIRVEQWNYTITGNTFTIDSRQEAGTRFVYTRVDTATGQVVMEAPPQNHILIGAWAWQYNELWQYTFNADGTGVGGLPDEFDTFRWTIPVSGQLEIRYGVGEVDRWNYVVDDNMLTITSRQMAGVTHSYIRVE